jgi:hypothetical protein
MEAFLRHPLPRVREWAEYEVQIANREADWFGQHDEEDGRI